MLEIGFFGTKAPLYMDIITFYFALLPFLMGVAILMAVKKRFELHFKMQLVIFIFTLIIVGIFEVGVRISGGFEAFMQTSNANYSWILIFLIIHIIVAIVSVALYGFIIYKAIKEFRLQRISTTHSHKKLGILVYIGMTLTSLMGIIIYYYLFVY